MKRHNSKLNKQFANTGLCSRTFHVVNTEQFSIKIKQLIATRSQLDLIAAVTNIFK